MSLQTREFRPDNIVEYLSVPRRWHKDLVEGEFIPSLNLVRVSNPKGNLLAQSGTLINSVLHLTTEESLFCVERNSMIVTHAGVVLSLPELYSRFSTQNMFLERSQVFSHLRRLGFVVRPSSFAQYPNDSSLVKVSLLERVFKIFEWLFLPPLPQNLPRVKFHLSTSYILASLRRLIQKVPSTRKTTPDFYLYPPRTSAGRNTLGSPMFALYVRRAHDRFSPEEIIDLHDVNIPAMLCLVDSGNINFLSLHPGPNPLKST